MQVSPDADKSATPREQPTTQPVQVPGQQRMWNKVSDPKYGVPWTIIVGLVGIAAGVLLTLALQPRKEIAYLIPNAPTKIFDSKAASPAFSVVDGSGQPIEHDLYVIEVLVWNSGNLPIEPEDVRGPVRLILFPASRILDIKTLNAIRPDIAEYRVAEASLSDNPQLLAQSNELNGLQSGTTFLAGLDSRQVVKALEVQWAHLDPGFGVRLQVTYEGHGEADEEFRTFFSGYAVGTKMFTKGILSGQNANGLLGALGAATMLTGMIYLAILVIKRRKRVLSNWGAVATVLLFLGVGFVALWVYVRMMLENLASPISPL